MGAASQSLMALRERAAAMAERVTLEASFVLTPAGTVHVRSAVEATLALRDDVIDDDHDPRCLHPARTILILLSDASIRDADTLAAAAFVESLPALLPDRHFAEYAGAAARAVLRPRAAALLREVPLPLPDDDDLLERLVAAPPDAALIALAERLDHARHLHMMSGVSRAPFHAGIVGVYMPAAARSCPPLFHRLDRWARSFARRRLTDAG